MLQCNEVAGQQDGRDIRSIVSLVLAVLSSWKRSIRCWSCGELGRVQSACKKRQRQPNHSINQRQITLTPTHYHEDCDCESANIVDRCNKKAK